ncbi:MAG: hypothetical protein ACXVI3_03615, partial [Halobacteriota archaeon]
APITVAVPGGTAVVLAPTTQAFAYIAVVALGLSIIGIITAFSLTRAPEIDLSEPSESRVGA